MNEITKKFKNEMITAINQIQTVSCVEHPSHADVNYFELELFHPLRKTIKIQINYILYSHYVDFTLSYKGKFISSVTIHDTFDELDDTNQQHFITKIRALICEVYQLPYFND
ncbi:hypothetical protein L0B53_15710 [Vibrio sp. SS-MA-C1-2]|uniref:hypothetical protein n=1 Tax=Vibrio sp. SS-MA-C1-2 TaxID=2908646 RepID=UPI001F1C0AAB|nr:hypothetical protein [Vibrio sp. SS-MA-C1-2]UJF18452.1 hypothetical protein L0B53_15710 [Vibrio sp. SS-MA-C1-2]